MRPCLAVPLLVFASAMSVASDGLIITTIHKPGDPVPGLPGFTMNGVGGLASINDAGDVIFSAAIDGDGVTLSDDNVLIAGPLADLRVVGRERDPVANLQGWIHLPGSNNFTGFSQLVVGPDGGIGYRASIFETGVGSTWVSGLFAGSADGPLPLVWETGGAPGFAPGYAVQQAISVAVGGGGRAAAVGRVLGPTFESALWATDPVNGPVVALSSAGSAPGLDAGIGIASIYDQSLRMNAQGRVATLVLLEGPGVDSSNHFVWYEGLSGSLSVLARRGEPVPGLPGASYTNFDERKMRLTASGDLCFATQISGGGTTAAFMRRRFGVLAPLVKVGDPVPDVPGASFTNLFSGHFDLNADGDVMFGATLTGEPASSDSAWFIAGDGGVRMVLREGDPLPGGLVTPEIGSATFYFNDRDQFVFEFNGVFYGSRPDGSLVKLAAAAEPFFTNDGFSGVVGAVVPWRLDSESLGAGSGRPCLFNSRGELVLSMYFAGSVGSALIKFEIGDPCPADLAAPEGQLDLADIGAFVDGFIGQSPDGDLDGNGLWDLTDISIFISVFTAGCP